MRKKKGKAAKVPKQRLTNDNHKEIAKSVTFLSNNAYVIGDILRDKAVSPKIKTALTALGKNITRLKTLLTEDWQAQNKPSGPYEGTTEKS